MKPLALKCDEDLSKKFGKCISPLASVYMAGVLKLVVGEVFHEITDDVKVIEESHVLKSISDMELDWKYKDIGSIPKGSSSGNNLLTHPLYRACNSG